MKTKTTPENMTIAELQAEIGRLQQILHWKVCGDPRTAIAIAECNIQNPPHYGVEI